MFTSRAEFRTLLRQDNADLRLTELSYNIGLASSERMEKVQRKTAGLEIIKTFLDEISIEPLEINDYLEEIGSSPLQQKQKAKQILLRPDLSLKSMIEYSPKLSQSIEAYPSDVLEQAEIQVKYEVYIEKEKELVDKMSKLEDLIIPDNFIYDRLTSLSAEARQKFNRIKPRTLGQASRISGVNPSDVQILMVYMGR